MSESRNSWATPELMKQYFQLGICLLVIGYNAEYWVPKAGTLLRAPFSDGLLLINIAISLVFVLLAGIVVRRLVRTREAQGRLGKELTAALQPAEK